MSDGVKRVRVVAMQLPGAQEQSGDGGPTFVVGGKPFAQVRDADAVHVRTDADGWAPMGIGPDADWALVEDAIAHGWELTAPADLLEAGGR